MLRKLRLVVVFTLAMLSGLCGIMLTASSKWAFVISRSAPTQCTTVSIESGALLVQNATATVAGTPPHFFRSEWTAYHTDSLKKRWVRWAAVPQMRSASTGWASFEQVWIPIWVPMLTFGLWPSIVAISAARRRQQSRGFEVAVQ